MTNKQQPVGRAHDDGRVTWYDPIPEGGAYIYAAPVQEAQTGMAWYNGCSEAERARWHAAAGSAVPADAYRAFCQQTAHAAVARPADERETFEAWARAKTDWNPNLERKGEGYAGCFAQTEWDAWRVRAAAPAHPAEGVPAAPVPCPYTGFAARYWEHGFHGQECPPVTGNISRRAYEEGVRARIAAAAPQTPAHADAVADAEIKAAYVQMHGTDAGWLDIQGSYFTSGWSAGKAAKAPAAPAEGEVLVEVSGLTGSGKSAICGEIEIMCRALGLDVTWPDGDPEKNMTHADWTAALEAYKPRVRIVERNTPRQSNGGHAK